MVSIFFLLILMFVFVYQTLSVTVVTVVLFLTFCLYIPIFKALVYKIWYRMSEFVVNQ